MALNSILILVSVLLGLSVQASAAVFNCFPDAEACPTGNHLRCVGYGWCGPNCDVCANGGAESGQQVPSDSVAKNIVTGNESCLEKCANLTGEASFFCTVYVCHAW